MLTLIRRGWYTISVLSTITDNIERNKVLNTTQLALYNQSKALATYFKSGYNVRS